MHKYITVIILPLFLFACTQQENSTNKKPVFNPESAQSIYVNEQYLYQFSYPSNAYVRNNDMGGDPTRSGTVTVYHPGEKNIFDVQSLELNDDLEKYSEKIWSSKENDKNPNIRMEIGNLENLNINGTNAYQFKLTTYFSNSYPDEPNAGYERYVFIKNNEFLYEIVISDQSEIAKSMLDSFEILPENNLITQRQANLDNCEANYAQGKDDCILDYARKEIFHGSRTNSDLCRSISSESEQSTECYWMFAMNNKDSKLCQFVKASQDEYFSKENCENELGFTTNNASWRLFYGVPPFKESNNSITYFGEAEIEGWLSDKGDDTLTFFEISPQSQPSLPPYLQKFKEFRLSYNDTGHEYWKLSEELLRELSKYNRDNPGKIKINRISIPGDGNVTTEIMKLPELHMDTKYNDRKTEEQKKESMNKTLSVHLEKCTTLSDSAEKDKCYENYASELVYWKNEILKSESDICEKISQGSSEIAQCYWLFAMKTRDFSLCELIPETASERSKESCKNDLFYSKDGASWQLKSGFPPYGGDPEALVYSGSAELKGWPVAMSQYLYDPQLQFHVSSESLKLLPPPMQKHEDYLLEIINEKGKYEKAPESIIEKLKGYNEQNPVTIRVTKAAFLFMEGPPSLIFEEIVE